MFASESSDDLQLEAAALALALVRFEQGAAHPYPETPAHETSIPGRDSYVFLPSARPVPLADAVAFLRNLPSPALLVPTTTRGIVAVLLESEAHGERRKSLTAILANQVAGLDTWSQQLGIDDADQVLLEFADEAHVVSLAVLRAWARRYGVHVRWNLRALEGDARARARLMLLRSDGESSWGGSCPLR